jgi:hypothetical protein
VTLPEEGDGDGDLEELMGTSLTLNDEAMYMHLARGGAQAGGAAGAAAGAGGAGGAGGENIGESGKIVVLFSALQHSLENFEHL